MSRRTRKARPAKDEPVSSPAVEPSGRMQGVIVTLLLTAYACLSFWNASTTSPTQDEPVHLAAGYTHVAAGDFRLNPEHPPLVKVLAALPVVISGALQIDPESGAPQSASFRGSRSNDVLRSEWNGLLARGEYWRLVHELFYGVRDDVLAIDGASRASELRTDRRYVPADFLQDGASLVLRARVVVLGFGLVLGMLVWLWTREMFGAVPAMLSLAIFAFDPNFVGHGALVTTDVPAAAAMFAAVYIFWRALRSGGWRNEAACAVSLAVASTVKFSTVLLAPILLVVGLVWILFPKTIGEMFPSTRVRVLRVVRLLVVGGVVAYLGIWAIYGFRFSAAARPETAAQLEIEHAPDVSMVPYRAPGRLPVEWTLRLAAADRMLLERWPDGAPLAETDRLARRVSLPAVDRALMAIHDRRLLPEGYLMGLAHVRFSILRGAFLKGEYSNVGFPDYFAWAFLYKTSLPVLVLLALVLSGIVTGPWERRRHLLLLLVPVVIYGIVALRSSLNIGHRHIFPIYPFLFVAVGAVAARWIEKGNGPALRRMATAAGLVVLSSIVVFSPMPGSLIPPHHLSYFNELAGGPTGGNRHLVDSNCDWGQDLPALASWIEENAPDEPIHLCYFGSADPRAYGISFVNMTGGFVEAPVSRTDPRNVSGLIAISVTNLRGVVWSPNERAIWREALANAKLVGRAGYSILIYRRE